MIQRWNWQLFQWFARLLSYLGNFCNGLSIKIRKRIVTILKAQLRELREAKNDN